MLQHHDPTSHAEIEAIRAARLQPTYADTVLYTTAFPCLMCAGAIVALGIPTVVVGARGRTVRPRVPCCTPMG